MPGPAEWHFVLHTFAATDSSVDDPVRVSQTPRIAGRAMLTVERVTAPIESFTIRVADEGRRPHFALEWDSLRVRVPVRLRP
ncbi:MAG: hypothetical protein IPF98_07895 [Gemmatimonadetes bacterium]|nr:hypothetical protein [Gemmatimonadota bacterium]